jgi:hypothetical protein
MKTGFIGFNTTNLNLNWFVLLFLFVVLIFYTIYAVLVFKQVKILNKTIFTQAAAVLNTIALIHLLLSLVILGLVAVAVLF